MSLHHVYNKDEFEKMDKLYAQKSKDVAICTFQGCIAYCWTDLTKPKFQVTAQWHKPYQTKYSKWVGFFRESKSRLISAYFDHQHTEGLVFDKQKHFKNPETAGVNNTDYFKKYIGMHDMRGCQVMTQLMNVAIIMYSELCIYFLM
jgi:hypothetical protein